jgi:dTDP-4-dehydrorhamnose 3,5-epimerase
LSALNKSMLYIPKGFANGFISLNDNTEIYYLISDFYAPESARGFRWDDPAFGISWPIKPTVMSEKDKNYPDFDERILK